MRSNAETSNLVAWSDDKDKLLNWYRLHLVNPYIEYGDPSFETHGHSHSWHKVFAKGSPLEWYNPMDFEDGTPNCFGQGLYSEWVDMENLPHINIGYRIY